MGLILKKTDTAEPSHQDAVEQATDSYDAKLRPLLEPQHKGHYVAIHSDTEQYLVERSLGRVFRAMRAKQPTGKIILRHIGPADTELQARLRGERPR